MSHLDIVCFIFSFHVITITTPRKRRVASSAADGVLGLTRQACFGRIGSRRDHLVVKRMRYSDRMPVTVCSGTWLSCFSLEKRSSITPLSWLHSDSIDISSDEMCWIVQRMCGRSEEILFALVNFCRKAHSHKNPFAPDHNIRPNNKCVGGLDYIGRTTIAARPKISSL